MSISVLFFTGSSYPIPDREMHLPTSPPILFQVDMGPLNPIATISHSHSYYIIILRMLQWGQVITYVECQYYVLPTYVCILIRWLI